MGKTIAEKIFGDHVGRPVSAGDVVIAPLDYVFWDDSNRPQACEVFRELGGTRVFDPSRVGAFLDHAGISPNPAVAMVHRTMREFSREQGIRVFDVGQGIAHQLIPEHGLASPGDILVGADSHTCTVGALNAMGLGVGSSDLATALLTGKLWFRVPRTTRFVLSGNLAPGVYSKDLALHLLSLVGAGGAIYESIEFTGPAIRSLSMEARFSMTNMAVEMGAKTGVMEIDDVARAWMEGRVRRPGRSYSSDPDAESARTIDVDVSTIPPLVAKPPSPANGISVEDLAGTPIHQAVIGTCTNGRLEDFREAARILRGRRIAPGVQLFITPASRSVLQAAMGEGLLDLFLDAGAVLGTPGCGGCAGGSGFAIPADGINMITTANRNFKGRTGNSKAFIYLASPATVMASAVAGAITDPRSYL